MGFRLRARPPPPPRRYGKTSRWRHKARYGGKPAFLKFYSSYFLFGQTPRPSGIRPSGRQDQALSGRGASPSESGRRLMCRPACWNIFYPLNLASRDTVGGRRAANGGIRQTARFRARRIAGWKTPLARLPKGDVRKSNTPLWPDAMYRVTALFYPCALIMVKRFSAIRNRLLGPPLPRKRESGT
ncbi:Uncharacterised protein [Neisseria meningitidis]|nr:Uncharacterised protein [Neisseria meningitidis]